MISETNSVDMYLHIGFTSSNYLSRLPETTDNLSEVNPSGSIILPSGESGC